MIVFVTWLQEGSDPRVFILSFSPRVGSPNSCFSLSLLSVCLCLLWLLFYSFNERSRMIHREVEGQKTTWFACSLPPCKTDAKDACCPPPAHSYLQLTTFAFFSLPCLCLLLLSFYSLNERSRTISIEGLNTTWFASFLPPALPICQTDAKEV